VPPGQQLSPQPRVPAGPARAFGGGEGRLGVLVLPAGSLWASAVPRHLLGAEAGCRELPGRGFVGSVGPICCQAAAPGLCCIRIRWPWSCGQQGSAPVSDQAATRAVPGCTQCLASSTPGWLCSLRLRAAALWSVLSRQTVPGFGRAPALLALVGWVLQGPVLRGCERQGESERGGGAGKPLPASEA